MKKLITGLIVSLLFVSPIHAQTAGGVLKSEEVNTEVYLDLNEYYSQVSTMSAQVTSATGNYTWDIPSDFSINSGNPLNISISDADIADDQILEVTVASQNGFKLKSESNQEIAYELYESGNQSPLASNASVLKYQPGKTNKVSNSLSAQTVSMPDNLCSGSFKDTLVFTSGVNIDPDYAYSITYNLDGGTLSGNYPTSYTSSAGLSTLPTPTKDGYTFAGWYEVVNDVPITINDNWGKNEDGSIYIDYYHYDASVSTYAPDPGNYATRYNSIEFTTTKPSTLKFKLQVNGQATCSANTIYQIIKDGDVYFESEKFLTNSSYETVEYNGIHELPSGNFQIIISSYSYATTGGYAQTSAVISNIIVQEVTDITSIPSGTTGDKTLTAKWNKIITFNIGKTSYQADDGMTWGEWANSEYNTLGYAVRSEIYLGSGDGVYAIGDRKSSNRYDTDSLIQISEIIVESAQYYINFVTI